MNGHKQAWTGMVPGVADVAGFLFLAFMTVCIAVFPAAILIYAGMPHIPAYVIALTVGAFTVRWLGR